MPLPAFLTRLFGPRVDPHAAVRPLWHCLVGLAREPAWYARAGVADSVTGRFDMVCVVLALVLLRMEGEPGLAREMALLTELFVTDMDAQLRESGVGDVVVGKHIGRLMGALGGRLGALREALAVDRPAGDAALEKALARNITLTEAAQPQVAARMVSALADAIAGCDATKLLAGEIPLPEALI